MKKIIFVLGLLLAASCVSDYGQGCLTGAFLADRPSAEDIDNFKAAYGKKPYLTVIFTQWGAAVDEQVLKDVYSEGCALLVTWEPWQAATKTGVDFDKIIAGDYDEYIKSFALRLKSAKGDVYLRFAHEMNGNWYPWAGIRIGKDRFIKAYRHIKDVFGGTGADNVKWVFSINWENIPEGNDYKLYYPGGGYVDFIGIDGYNWGVTQAWSRWMGFKDIFVSRYEKVRQEFKKPVIISEFSSTSKGGDKAEWIKEAMADIKRMKNIKAFVLFNVNKETDWGFPAGSPWGRELEKQLKDSYFKEGI